MFQFSCCYYFLAHNTFNLRTKAHLFSDGRFRCNFSQSDAKTDGLMHGVKCNSKSLSYKLIN